MSRKHALEAVEGWLREYGPSLPDQRSDLLEALTDPGRYRFYHSVAEEPFLLVAPAFHRMDEHEDWVLVIRRREIPRVWKLVEEISFFEDEDPYEADDIDEQHRIRTDLERDK